MVTHLKVSRHALTRLRERWPGALHLSPQHLTSILTGGVEQAVKDGKAVRTPGGIYHPFSLNGKRGFLVVKEQTILTVLDEEYCQEVVEYLERHVKQV